MRRKRSCARCDGRQGDVEQGDDPERQASNTILRVALEHAEATAGPGAIDRILARAGEKRQRDVVLDDSCWSSYGQFRRLLEAARVELGGLEPLTHVDDSADISSGSMPSATDMLQLLGSPHV